VIGASRVVLIPLGPDLPHAACRGPDAALWDEQVEGELPSDRPYRHALAIAICQRCSDVAACYIARLADPDLGGGVWGGHVFSTHTRRLDR
jgi:Transcription factor WhiB